MFYSAVFHEVYNRLRYHAAEGRMLDGLKVKKSATYSVDGDKNLPAIMLVDLNSGHAGGSASGRLTMFLRTLRKHDYVALEADDPKGLIDWAELVHDALETSPSSGTMDPKFHPHRKDGTAILTAGSHDPLFAGDLSWDVRMATITDLSFEIQLEIIFNLAAAPLADRVSAGLQPSDYVVETE